MKYHDKKYEYKDFNKNHFTLYIRKGNQYRLQDLQKGGFYIITHLWGKTTLNDTVLSHYRP